MPEMDGVTASQEIRKAGLNQQTPIVAVTAHAMPGERERLIDAGMDDYLTKPIEEAMLESTLSRWLHFDDTVAPHQPRHYPLIRLTRITVRVIWTGSGRSTKQQARPISPKKC